MSSRPISNSAASEMSSRPSGTTRRSWSPVCASGSEPSTGIVRCVGWGVSGPRYQERVGSPRRVRWLKRQVPGRRDLGHRRRLVLVEGAEQADLELVHQSLEAAVAGAHEVPRDEDREAVPSG